MYTSKGPGVLGWVTSLREIVTTSYYSALYKRDELLRKKYRKVPRALKRHVKHIKGLKVSGQTNTEDFFDTHLAINNFYSHRITSNAVVASFLEKFSYGTTGEPRVDAWEQGNSVESGYRSFFNNEAGPVRVFSRGAQPFAFLVKNRLLQDERYSRSHTMEDLYRNIYDGNFQKESALTKLALIKQ